MSFADAAVEILADIMVESWDIFAEAAPYLLLGFGIAGLLHVFVPDDKVMQYLGSSAGKFRSVINASFLGVPLPLCSCGVVPAALSLRKRGATKGATLSFLISTPQTGVDSIAITYALLDPIMTVFRPVATFATAVVAGVAENILNPSKDKDDKLPEKPAPLNVLPMFSAEPDSCGCSSCGPHEEAENFIDKVKAGAKYAYIELLGEIGFWLIVGVVVAGIISYVVPENLVGNYLGGGIASMLLALIVGIPLYICATASTPLAAVLILKGMSPGAAFVFLLAGPATNAATITMVLKFLGRRTTAVYLASIALCAVVCGLVLDQIYSRLGIDVISIAGSASEVMPEEVKNIFAVILLPLLLYGMYAGKKCTE
ncbi:SO_0444 family Cu/Zn efflux transporter [Methanococcoides methylutens]|uniref:Transporter n=1 Tax=Methanococcoides methylutens MM1 TaxID=1434104 RepID=A0A0E3WYV8_METMT|nr:SO_0444 family Cu/Zn efflux transporter [Methanococcoides methylutens]AKB84244.1 Transporter [Methanococcoides methylutens MM1]